MIQSLTEIDQIKNTDVLEVKEWLHRNKHSTMKFVGWDPKLWNKPYPDITEYLMRCFETTQSDIEYYNCMLYLWKHIDKEYLYVPFTLSPQYTGIKNRIGIRGVKRVKSSNIKVRGG